MSTTLYDCAICGCCHPWNWDGDCRDDANRYGSPEEYAEMHNLNVNDIEVLSMDQVYTLPTACFKKAKP